MNPIDDRRLLVGVHATDPVSLAGLSAFLRTAVDIDVLPKEWAVAPDVAVVATDRVDPETVATLRRLAADSPAPTVLVTNPPVTADVVAMVTSRVTAVLSRATLTPAKLAACVHTVAAGGGVLPPDLLGELLTHVDRLHREVLTPRGLTGGALTTREIDLVRLIAEGFDTNRIARELDCAERTVTNILQELLRRLDLRNREHAVAFSLRAGLI